MDEKFVKIRISDLERVIDSRPDFELDLKNKLLTFEMKVKLAVPVFEEDTRTCSLCEDENVKVFLNVSENHLECPRCESVYHQL